MTATFDTMTHAQPGPRGPSMMRSVDPWWLARQVSGTLLVLLAFAVMMAPTTQTGGDAVVLKLGLAMFLSLAGLILVRDRDTAAGPEVEIDTVRREVRKVQGRGRARTSVERTPMRDLGQAEIAGDILRLTSASGELLTEVSMADPKLRARLCGALQDAGKL
ncbi:MAG: hypothetical protein AAGF36_02735 [Pseudomonadota bacterium]